MNKFDSRDRIADRAHVDKADANRESHAQICTRALWASFNTLDSPAGWESQQSWATVMCRSSARNVILVTGFEGGAHRAIPGSPG